MYIIMKILSIGNSFAQDSTAYLHEMSKTGNVNIDVINLFIGGCSLEHHFNNIERNISEYAYEKNGERIESRGLVSLNDILLEEKWDFITIQQVSYLSGLKDTYQPYFDKIYNYLKQNAPKSELIIHKTWAYDKEAAHKGFENYDWNQEKMYVGLTQAYEGIAKEYNLRFIPCGNAMQLARAHNIPMNRDGFHAHLLYGRYLLSAVWYQFFSGNDIENNPYSIDGITDSELRILKNCSKEALLMIK